MRSTQYLQQLLNYLNARCLTLGSWEAILGPAEGPSVLSQQRVLLLNAEPRSRVLSAGHDRVARLTEVGLCKNQTEELKLSCVVST
jgi:hypothetical protein